VVPDDLLAVFRQREGDTSRSTSDTITTGNQLGSLRIEARSIIDTLRRSSAAAGREYPQEVIRVRLQQHLQARRQLRLILRHILAIDLIQRRVSTVRVWMVHARLVVGWRLRQTTVPRRNSTGSVTSALTAQGGQVLAQARSLSTVNIGLCL